MLAAGVRSGKRFVTATVITLWLSSPLTAAASFVTFESGPVRPLALSSDGTKLFAVNIPDNCLEIFAVGSSGELTLIATSLSGVHRRR